MKPTLPALSLPQSLTRETRLVFVHDMLQELLPLVRVEQCELLIYLLKMAMDEALLQSVRAGSNPEVGAGGCEPPPPSH
jgi:hypothetical protein